ncbi:MAG: ribonuclease HII [Anaerovoracaceae bacterium]|nr:ribonuclease HII [Anaerovoracaceae bacterium]
MTKAERQKLLEEKLVTMQAYENELRAEGIRYIGGVDEVGRGPLAGPVTAACVVLPEDFDVLGVDDSKKLSEKKREELFDKIREKALAVGIGMCDNRVIDEINILEATKKAMAEAIRDADSQLEEKGLSPEGTEHLLIDAVSLKDVDKPQTSIIKGDAKSLSIAAASIIAKVTRDRLMAEYHRQYPYYGFDTNKGYGTKAHYEGIDKYGITPIHRKTFLKNIL